jgi:adenylate cyclase
MGVCQEKRRPNMAFEIERKYLPSGTHRIPLPRECHLITQGYLAREGGNAVRIRTTDADGLKTAVLCVKGSGTNHGTPEFEYHVPLVDAEELLHLCGKRVLTKRRYHVETLDHLFEVDEFLGSLKGLWVIELELATPKQKQFLPHWVGKEITKDPRYFNARLVESGIPT